MPSGVPSSAMFHEPKFSADLERLADADELARRWNGGNGIVAFNCGIAREFGFDTRHEPEPFGMDLSAINDAHCNVYCDIAGDNARKKKARSLAATCKDGIRRKPDPVPPAAAKSAGASEKGQSEAASKPEG